MKTTPKLEIIGRFRAARDKAKELLREEYPERVQEYRALIARQMARSECGEVEATVKILKTLEAEEGDTSPLELLIMAACCEIVEGKALVMRAMQANN